jgi:hypothetical protein
VRHTHRLVQRHSVVTACDADHGHCRGCGWSACPSLHEHAAAALDRTDARCSVAHSVLCGATTTSINETAVWHAGHGGKGRRGRVVFDRTTTIATTTTTTVIVTTAATAVTSTAGRTTWWSLVCGRRPDARATSRRVVGERDRGDFAASGHAGRDARSKDRCGCARASAKCSRGT